MRLIALAVVASVLLALGGGPVLAEKRVGLVIGNGAYRNVPRLLNPGNDATDVSASLQRLGFSVSTVRDGSFDDMRRALLRFGREAAGADMAVVYFAGHGIEISGENWLIPVDAELRSDQDAEAEAISLKSAMLQVAGAKSLGLVILDACRDNPFAAQMQRRVRQRSVVRGLARVEPTGSVLVAYASREGTTAADGGSRNSPFTSALLRYLETPGLEISFVFRHIRDDVIQATGSKQEPFVYGSLSRQAIYLKPSVNNQATAEPRPSQTPSDEAAVAWAAVKDTTSQAVLEDFIRRYGGSLYGTLARARLEELKKSQVAVVAPPATAILAQGNLTNPAALTEQAPATYKARFDTSRGAFVIDVRREWSPLGADRFYNLVKNGFYDDNRFFRAISGFMVQFGINGNPQVSAPWRSAQIKDDPVKQSNKRGFITFATSGPNSRTTQVFINFNDNSRLDSLGFAPFGEVTSGMNVVDQLYSDYGEGAPSGRGPNQGRIQAEGNTYLTKEFPNLDFVRKASIGH